MKKIFIPLKSYLLKQHHSNHFRTILLHLLELVYYVHKKTTMSLDQIFNLTSKYNNVNIISLYPFICRNHSADHISCSKHDPIHAMIQILDTPHIYKILVWSAATLFRASSIQSPYTGRPPLKFGCLIVPTVANVD